MYKSALTICVFTIFLFELKLFASDFDPNTKNEKIFHCGVEPNLSELYFHANQIKDPKLALDILEKIESIRPNCIDVQISKMIQYATLNDMNSFHKTELRVKELKQKEKILYGSQTNASPVAPSPISPQKEVKGLPPKKDKINYWKWLYIYSQLRK